MTFQINIGGHREQWESDEAHKRFEEAILEEARSFVRTIKEKYSDLQIGTATFNGNHFQDLDMLRGKKV